MPKQSPIVFYINPDGSGHRRRSAQIITALKQPVHVIVRQDLARHFSDLPQVSVHSITQEDIDHLYRVLRAPKELEPGQSPRLEETTQYRLLQEIEPTFLHIDVCTEFAELAQVLMVPYTYTLMHGSRMNNLAHVVAYAQASALIAPFHISIRDQRMPDWVHRKTTYTGLLSSRELSPEVGSAQIEKGLVSIIAGKGFARNYDDKLSADVVATLSKHFPQYTFQIIGSKEEVDKNSKVRYLGELTDPMFELARSEVVIGTCGYNILSEVAQLGKKYITVPADTPFDEQLIKAKILHAKGYAAAVRTPHSLEQWDEAFNALSALQPLRDLYDEHASEIAAKVIHYQLKHTQLH